MNPPPLLLGATLLFWGWQTGFLLVGAILALVLESARWIKIRLDFSDDDFSRIWVFCTLLFLASAIYAFTANEGPSNFRGFFQNPNFSTQRHAGASSARTAASLIQWLPMVYFLFVLAQTASSRQVLPIETISFILRRRLKKVRKAGHPVAATTMFNSSYCYFALCLIATSIQRSDNTIFFWGLCILVPWALWSYRSPRFSLIIWSTTLGVAIVLGYFGQGGLTRLRSYLEHFNPQWLSSLARRGSDAGRTRTAIGQVGQLKMSARIVIRLETKKGESPPNLLREASYRSYKAQEWFAGNAKGEFESLNHTATNEASWILLPKTNNASVKIACYLSGGKDLLPLPERSGYLEHLPAFVLKKNGAGAVFAEGPGLVMFDAHYGPGESLDTPPENKHDLKNDDLTVPVREEAALTQILTDLDLASLSFEEKLRRVNGFFQQNFTYSKWQARAKTRSTNATALARFLLETRSGHCEYFATAATLLLRKVGIPTRYAVGYAVHEAAGRKYVVRLRDAHAWCLVWNEDRKLWQDFDTTPASWVEEESKHASSFQWLSDAWSRFGFEFAKIRWGQTRLRQYVLWALGPILALLLYQILVRSRRQRHKNEPGAAAGNNWQGLDSEFYQLEKKLAARGLPRQASEPLSVWLFRASDQPALVDLKAPLGDLLQLHYRYRFDPEGLTQTERKALQSKAREYLARL
jgi:protein-glutamine gamma-glutamyltransferase